MTMRSKLCKTCGVNKLRAGFYASANSYCKACHIERMRAYQETPKGKKVHAKAYAKYRATTKGQKTMRRCTREWLARQAKG